MILIYITTFLSLDHCMLPSKVRPVCQFPLKPSVHAAIPVSIPVAIALAFSVGQIGIAHAADAPSTTSTASAKSQPSGPSPQQNDIALPAVSVSASAPVNSPQQLETRMSNGALGTRSQLDTPFSTTVVDQEALASKQVSKLGDVFISDASVSDNSDVGNAWASYITVRGLQLDWQNGFKIDGMPFNGYGISLPYEQLERVELLKGLSGFMYGFVSPGGVVNYVTKKPATTPVRSVDFGYRNDGVFSEHVDLSQRFGPDQMFGARINATHEEGKAYNDSYVHRDAVSVALDAQLTKALSVDFNALYQERSTSGQEASLYTGQYVGNSLPQTISSGNSNLNSAGQHLNTNLQLYTGGVHYQFSPDWKASVNYSYSTARRDRNESALYLENYAGDYDDYRYYGIEAHQYSQMQAVLEGKVRTGPLTHQVVLGAAWQKQVNYYEDGNFSGLIGSGNIRSQNTNAYYPSVDVGTYRTSDITQKSLFFSDTISITDRLSVLAGIRYTHYQQRSFDTSGQTASLYAKDGVTTPSFAIMYKLDAHTTAYASYVEALEAGASVGTLYANAGALLNPLRSKQFEIGLKTAHERWSATAAVFRIERGAAYANSQNVYVQDGKSIYEGLEVAGAARLGSQWDVGGSVMALDSWYARGSANNSNRVAGAPTFVLAGHVGYQVPLLEGLELGADTKFTGNTELRASNNLQLPGFLLLNLGATYRTRIGHNDVTLRAALDNALNRRYWEFQYADYVRAGDPRTISLNAKIDF